MSKSSTAKIVECASGYKYSRKPFEGYRMRYIIKYDIKGERDTSNMTVYSNNPSQEHVDQLFLYRLRKIHGSDFIDRGTCIYHKSTKERDDRVSVWMDEFLKENT
jgi:hypothetical protein